MRIIPGLFIQNGKVVSLYKGTENDEKKIYPKSPHSYAKLWEEQGAKTLFVVDLSGNQMESLPEIRGAFGGELWWAGGVRSMETLKVLFEHGANRVVLGQSAESVFQEALAEYGSKQLIAGIQAFHYDHVPDLCQKRAELGFKFIIVKDMNADGTLFHPNFDLMEKSAYFSNAMIFASGGVSHKRDMRLLQLTGIKGVIIARALYEHHLGLPALIQEFEDAAH